MRWSWKIGEFAGIGVYIHATFLLILGWVGFAHWQQDQSVAATLAGIAFILVLFACVVLHEFGHALTARRYGIKTRDITLLPIGGLARLERMPTDPVQEFWVAVAGPAVNLAIAAVLFLILVFTGQFAPLERLSVAGGFFLQRLMIVNVFLVAFNMLPAFPMDGGRVLRATLARRMNYTKATQISATIGQGMALIFGLVGLFWNPFLVFIALFVWIGAAQESSMIQMKTALGGIPVERAMVTDFQILQVDDTLARAVELILSGSQQDFPVVEDGKVVGILTKADMLKALAEQGRDTSVSTVMQKDFEIVEASEMLETAFLRMKDCACRTIPITDKGGVLIGMLTMDNLGEFVMIQSALEKSKI